ncbi:TIM44-like domain-containing protein [Neptunomonas phycophila]|uniref:TIM44-like domain-containing protein n=1 Tax=Neptunomonas phycophila TaxID=1572645 RepID=A0ABT9ET61_9GAMM|nr:TIM44-like domain-containing protein [Neptunomonas phycophila]MDP2522134.1 TIM44-like domain-containing protein [Neptunomonas phycophila]
MRNFFIALLMSFFVVGITAPVADAARFGGGAKLGKTFTAPKKSSPAASNTQQKTPTQTAASGKKPGMMGGLMGGLLAGGLLSALFFGGAFDGIQLMDVLLIALVAFVLFKLFASKKQAQSQAQYAGAGGAQYRETAPEQRSGNGQDLSNASVDTLPTTSHGQYGQAETPAWFDKAAFVKGAQSHFENLQKAWDAQNWEEIATYTTPELLAELKAERAKHPADQTTEVVSVMADLFNFIDNQSNVVASVHFYGWIKESRAEQPKEFGEVWHLTRDMTQPNADWFIVGMEQEQTS